MTMTSIAVGPASLAAPNMFGPKRYHVQQGLKSPNSPLPSSPKQNYETFSKGKKSWSVRLGLSRTSQSSRQDVRSTSKHHSRWGTVTGGSVFSQQMIYCEPYLYGTIRTANSRPAAYITQLRHHHEAQVLLVCSCSDFLSNTVRIRESKCRKCGGRQLPGLSISESCRIPTTAIRTRPSLSGMLKPNFDDPYDLMRRSRLVEARSRARSISPSRQAFQREIRSQSVVCCNPSRERGIVQVATVDPISRMEWFDCSKSNSNSTPRSESDDCLLETNFNQSLKESDWISNKSFTSHEMPIFCSSSSRTVSMTNHSNKTRSWKSSLSSKQEEETSSTTSITSDSRRSILECDVNPYLLLKNQQQRIPSTTDEDELSDDLSDNALENDLQHLIDDSSSNLFDSSKVKSIERTPNRSSVAAIGGQRIRVFNEIREPSDEEIEHIQPQTNFTRIPIPKISPKRPPRKLKDARNRLKSILKRADKSLFVESKRKNVLFTVDNIILAPEKPDICSSFQRNIRKQAIPLNKDSSFLNDTKIMDGNSVINEAPIIPEEVQVERFHRYITIPNIKNLKQVELSQQSTQNRSNQQLPEAKIIPKVKTIPSIDKIKIDKFLPSKKQQIQNQHHRQIQINQDKNMYQENMEDTQKKIITKEENNTDLEELEKNEQTDIINNAQTNMEFQKINNKLNVELINTKCITVDEKDLIKKFVDCSIVCKPMTYLTRSQSDKSTVRMGTLMTNVGFADTMRLSLGRIKNKNLTKTLPNEFKRNINFKEVIRNTKVEPKSKIIESRILNLCVDKESQCDVNNETNNENLQKLKEVNAVINTNKNDQLTNTQLTSWSSSSLAADTNQRKNQNNSNICKITIAPKSIPLSFMVHKLQIGSGTTMEKELQSNSSSIMVNNKQQIFNSKRTSDLDNKVTISVSGEDTICNSTIISVNNNAFETLSNIQTCNDQKRTLVIFENYRSNIVINGDKKEKQLQDMNANEIKMKTNDTGPDKFKSFSKFKGIGESSSDTSNWKKINNDQKYSENSKEELISKLLEDSLRKARENGEILDESSGESILKILKQNLLKSSQSTSELETEYFTPPYNLNSNVLENNLIPTNMFLEENAYEVIKEPIYEEILDEPPPLPLSPPPTEDFVKDRIFFGDEYENSFRDLNTGFTQSLDSYYKTLNKNSGQCLEYSYLSKALDKSFKKTSISSIANENNMPNKFELLNFIMDSKERIRVRNVVLEQEEEIDVEEDQEQDLEALYEQKETSLGDLSSKSSQISNISDSSEDCNIILPNSPETLKTRTVDIERTDSGVGSESSQASSGRSAGIGRRWRAEISEKNNLSLDICESSINGRNTINTMRITNLSHKSDINYCEDCQQWFEPFLIDSGSIYSHLVCRKCCKKRAERKEIITEIVETEQKYGRDLQIILEEFHRPMLRAGLLTSEQLSAIFLNVDELLEHNQILAEKLKDAINVAQKSSDKDLVTVDLGKIFLESERMLHAFESYCTRQGGASLLLQNLEKEKELLRIFLKVSQMENAVLRRMNLNSFLMVPVQRVTKYPLLLARLLKATVSGKTEMQDLKKRLEQARSNIELHLEHMNAEAKDITSMKLWRRISIIQSNRKSTSEQDMVNIKLRKMALEVLGWVHEDSRFVLEGRLVVAQPTDNNWRKARTVKLAPIIAMLVTNGKSNADFLDCSDDCLFPRRTGIKDATLLIVKEKMGRYSLLREPLYLDKCIVCCETNLEDYFEVQELCSRETFIFKAEDGTRTRRWCRTLQTHAQSLGAWRRRRGALPNIMICGIARN